MSSMITKIRILRKKCHDIECIYVLEFLKLIGCLVFDRVFPNEMSSEINQIMSEDELNENYDVNICYGIWGDIINETEKKGFEYIEPEDNENQKISAEKFLHVLVQRLWPDSDNPENKIVYLIKELYVDNKIFIYLYNKGNFKFIREYISIHSINAMHSDKTKKPGVRENLCDKTYSIFLEFYQKLMGIKSSQIKEPVYLQFAKINLAQDLNETRELMGNGRVFRTDYMLEALDDILNDFPKMIRCHYLEGIIYSFNNQNLLNSFLCYLTAEDEAKKDNLPTTLLGFIYYQMGKCLEKKKRSKSTAYDAYSKAYIANPYMMRALYKLAEIEYGKGEYEKAVKHSNEIIHVLLNGYPMNEAMPGQQLYAYKSLVLLGDIYQAEERHELAIRCYERALELAKTRSLFYEVWDDAHISFGSIQKMCMPIQPIYYKIINCASICNDVNQRAKYYEILQYEK